MALSTTQKRDLLKGLELLSALDDASLMEVARQTQELDFGPGDVIVAEGEQGDSLFIVSSGSVRVTKAGSAEMLAEFGPGQAFGELSLFDDQPRSASVTATADTHVLLLNREHMIGVIEHTPRIALALLKLLAHRVRMATDRALRI